MKKLLVSLPLLLILIFAITGCGGQNKQFVAEEKAVPQIPHKVDNTTDCAECHKDGKNGAPVTKHLDRSNCTQCHKEGK